MRRPDGLRRRGPDGYRVRRYRGRHRGDLPVAVARRERHRDEPGHYAAAGHRTGCCPSAEDAELREHHRPDGPDGVPGPGQPVPGHRRPQLPDAPPGSPEQQLPGLRAPGSQEPPNRCSVPSVLLPRVRPGAVRPPDAWPEPEHWRPGALPEPVLWPELPGPQRPRPVGRPVRMRPAAELPCRDDPVRRPGTASSGWLPRRWSRSSKVRSWRPVWSPGMRRATCGRRGPRWSRTGI